MADIRLLLGDCVEVMRSLDAGSIDLLLTSPPYDHLRRYSRGSSFDFEALADECNRALKPGGVLVWVVGDQTKDGDESGTSFRQALHFKSIGLKLRDTMIWRKANPRPCGDWSHYLGSFEFMFVFTKGKPSKINVLREPCKTPGRSQSWPMREHGGPRKPSTGRKVTGDTKPRANVWDIASGSTSYDHPAPFPLQLAVDHILSWTNEGDTVLDCFAGSGTTLEACLRTNRNGIGIEISPEYLAVAEKRIAAERDRYPLLTA